MLFVSVEGTQSIYFQIAISVSTAGDDDFNVNSVSKPLTCYFGSVMSMCHLGINVSPGVMVQ